MTIFVGDNDHGDSKPTLPKIMNEVYAKHDAECLRLTEQLNKTIIERDEARKMYCGVDNCTADEAMLLAKEQGWDCYKKEETQ